MELEKSESVLGSLYTLRGGLSAISVERDKARLADEECFEKLKAVAGRVGLEHGADKDDEENEDGDRTLKYCEWLCGDEPEKFLNRAHSELLDDLKSEEDFVKQQIKEKEHGIKEKVEDDSNKRIYRYKKDKKEAIKYCLIDFSLLLLTVLLLTPIFILVASPNSATAGAVLPFIGLGGMGAGVAFVFFIIRLVWLIKDGYITDAIKGKKELKRELEDLQIRLEKDAERIACEREEIKKERIAEKERIANKRENIEENFKELIERLPEVQEEARKLLSERNAEIKLLAESCEAYHKALTAQFTPLLDERDWQHLDLVIYQLETRRADSVKEALQLVDRELQTERLESSIGVAIKSISYTLAHGFTALQESIRKNCTELSGRLQDTNLQLSAAVGQISAANRQLEAGSARLVGVSEKLAELSDSVNVGNALQEKANETSAQLMDDIHEIKYYNIDRVV